MENVKCLTRALNKQDQVVQRIVKTLITKYGIYADIFAKNVSSICKTYSHFFCKNICELYIVLTRTVNIWPLTSSLS